MKLAVIGSRKFTDYELLINRLSDYSISQIISGGAQGADTLAADYACTHGIPLLEIRPDWSRYGRSAGPIRNKEIINKADKVIAFWDGSSRGTAQAVAYARSIHRPVDLIVDWG